MWGSVKKEKLDIMEDWCYLDFYGFRFFRIRNYRLIDYLRGWRKIRFDGGDSGSGGYVESGNIGMIYVVFLEY